MNFVDENDGAARGMEFALGVGHDVFDFLDAGKDGAKRNEFGFCETSDDAGERSFAASRRSPEKHRAEIVGFDLNAKRFSGTEEFFLADEFVERARAHAFGERLVGGGRIVGRKRGEEGHGMFSVEQKRPPQKAAGTTAMRESSGGARWGACCAGGRLRRRGRRRLRRR